VSENKPICPNLSPVQHFLSEIATSALSCHEYVSVTENDRIRTSVTPIEVWTTF